MREVLGVQPSERLTVVSDDRDESRTFTKNEPALDVFYKITPSLTGVVTANTNFAETSVDEVQVNLTRFSLFFPEQRDFFLQDAGIFQFADLEKNGIPFFSRRIGIAANGEDIPIRIGGKLTGRQGPWNVGLLSVRTGQGSNDLACEEPADPDAPLPTDARLLGAAKGRAQVPQEPAVNPGDPHLHGARHAIGT